MVNTAYKIVGLFSLALAIAGAFLPLLPTTCFVLLSAWCFAKSSPVWHQRLCRSRWFGPLIVQWEATHCIPYQAKVIAIGSMVVFGAISFIMLDSTVLRIILLSLIGIGILVVHHFSKRCVVAGR